MTYLSDFKASFYSISKSSINAGSAFFIMKVITDRHTITGLSPYLPVLAATSSFITTLCSRAPSIFEKERNGVQQSELHSSDQPNFFIASCFYLSAMTATLNAWFATSSFTEEKWLNYSAILFSLGALKSFSAYNLAKAKQNHREFKQTLRNPQKINKPALKKTLAISPPGSIAHAAFSFFTFRSCLQKIEQYMPENSTASVQSFSTALSILSGSAYLITDLHSRTGEVYRCWSAPPSPSTNETIPWKILSFLVPLLVIEAIASFLGYYQSCLEVVHSLQVPKDNLASNIICLIFALCASVNHYYFSVKPAAHECITFFQPKIPVSDLEAPLLLLKDEEDPNESDTPLLQSC